MSVKNNIIDSLVNEDMSSIRFQNKELEYSYISLVSFVNELSESKYNTVNSNIRSNGKVIVSFLDDDKVVVCDVGSVSYGNVCAGSVYQIKGRASTIQNCLDYIVDIINNDGFSDMDDFLLRMKKYKMGFYSDVGFDIQKYTFMNIDYLIKSFIAKNKFINKDLHDELRKYEFKIGRDYTLDCGVCVNKYKTYVGLYCVLAFTVESGLYKDSVMYDKVKDFLNKCRKAGQCCCIVPYDTSFTFGIDIFKAN